MEKPKRSREEKPWVLSTQTSSREPFMILTWAEINHRAEHGFDRRPTFLLRKNV